VTIRKLKNGLYKFYGKKLTVVEISPNLRKHLITFMKYDTDVLFLKKLARSYPLVKTRKAKIKVEKFGGCWYIRSAKDERLLTIHDPETDDIKKINYSKPSRRKIK